MNLRAIRTIKKNVWRTSGISDHTHGIDVPIAAVALGASVVEKHFTLDRRDAIRHVEVVLGNEVKPARSINICK